MNATQANSTSAAMASRHRRVAIVLSGVVFFMVAAAYAAVPLYRLFCQTTGYGGTPKIAATNDVKILDRTIEVRLDANVGPNLPWEFKAKQNSVTVRLGETVLVHYQATNLGKTTTHGSATYNVSPDSSGAYFNKIACFCFTEQKLEPGETVDMPVTFFVDPALIDDAWAKAKDFFALPEDTKRAYHIPGGGGARGYTPFGTEIAKGAKRANAAGNRLPVPGRIAEVVAQRPVSAS